MKIFILFLLMFSNFSAHAMDNYAYFATLKVKGKKSKVIELAKNKQLKEVIKDINCNISAPKTSLIDSGLAPILGYLD